MALHSFNTTALQEAAISYKRQRVNQERAAMTPPQPPFDDNAAFVAFAVENQILGPLVPEFVEARLQMVANAYRIATPAQRQSVDSTLGL
jgi:hypothetical protein